MNKEERKSMLNNIGVCTGCKQLNFALMKCKRYGCLLNSFTDSNGYVSPLKSKDCKEDKNV